jgi:hypothetical protein
MSNVRQTNISLQLDIGIKSMHLILQHYLKSAVSSNPGEPPPPHGVGRRATELSFRMNLSIGAMTRLLHTPFFVRNSQTKHPSKHKLYEIPVTLDCYAVARIRKTLNMFCRS